MTNEEKLKALETAMQNVKKQYGQGAVMKLGDPAIDQEVQKQSSGCLSLDIALGGGIPKGRIIEIYGPESCIDENTFVLYELRNKDGKRINKKGGTIKNLYERFHNLSTDGRKNKIDRKNVQFYINSINEDDRVIRQVIADVKKCGKKECYELKTERGKSIIATKDHKFYIGNGKYEILGNLDVGEFVYIHDNIASKEKKHELYSYPEKFVKYYPNGPQKIVNGCKYYRVDISHLVYEANLNGYEYNDFLNLLNDLDKKDIIDNLKFIDKTKYDIHHKDLNPLNNSLDNLELLLKSEHYRLHAKSNQKYMSFVCVPDKIISIEPCGERETYDIKCFQPYNNYIANNIVVHNCGKTTLALSIVSEVQKNGGTAAFIDAEHAMDPVYAKNIGVNIDNLLISQPDCGEQALDITENLVRSGALDVVVIDSVAALVPKAELEGDMGDANVGLQARLLSKGLRMLTGVASKSGCIIIFINQLREKIGVMFGNNETTAGGRALRFFASVRIDIRKIDTIKINGEPSGNRVRAKVVKNKVAPPFKTAEFDIVFGKGISKEGDVLDLAVAYDIVNKSGAWFSYKGEKIGQGREKTKDYLRENPEVMKEISELVMEKYNEERTKK